MPRTVSPRHQENRVCRAERDRVVFLGNDLEQVVDNHIEDGKRTPTRQWTSR